MSSFRCTRTKSHTRTGTRPAPQLTVDEVGSALLQPAWHPLVQVSYILHKETWGCNNHQDLLSLQDRRRLLAEILFFTLGCAKEGGGGGIWQQGAEKQERTGDVFCSAPSSSPALAHLLCNLKLPVSNIIYGKAQAESQNQEAKSSFPDVILHLGY